MNNHGFAISSILYGILIMTFLIVLLLMSLMSNNRQNNSTFVEKVESELNRYSQTKTTITPTDDTLQRYITPSGHSGWYKIELWGAAGVNILQADGTIRKKGGYGSYTTGMIYLQENESLYFHIGKNGGATDVRVIKGNDRESATSRIMVAAGGADATSSSDGGNGGGLLGFNQSGGYGSASQNDCAGEEQNTNGGGYCHGTQKEGGSSYIAGYAGVISYQDGIYSNDKTKFTYQKEINKIVEEELITEKTRSEKHFINGWMVPGVNAKEGKATIQKISSDALTPAKKNTKLNNVRYIRDCISNDTSSTREWSEIQAIIEGENIITPSHVKSTLQNPESLTNGKITESNKATMTVANINDASCIFIDLNYHRSLDELAVWHNYQNNLNYKHTLEVSENNINWTPLKAGTKNGYASEVETANGVRYSAWQPDSMSSLDNGIYYIFPAQKSNEVITAQSTGNINSSLLGPTTAQKWQLEKIGESTYKITNIMTGKVLEYETNLTASKEYNESSSQQWNIQAIGNGNYTLKVKDKYLTSNNTGLTLNLGPIRLSQNFHFILAD